MTLEETKSMVARRCGSQRSKSDSQSWPTSEHHFGQKLHNVSSSRLSTSLLSEQCSSSIFVLCLFVTSEILQTSCCILNRLLADVLLLDDKKYFNIANEACRFLVYDRNVCFELLHIFWFNWTATPCTPTEKYVDIGLAFYFMLLSIIYLSNL